MLKFSLCSYIHGTADAVHKRLEWILVRAICLNPEFASGFGPSVRCCRGLAQMFLHTNELWALPVEVELLSV